MNRSHVSSGRAWRQQWSAGVHTLLRRVLRAPREQIPPRTLDEASLLESEKRFRALIEHTSDALALVSAEATILWASPSTTRVLGYALEEFIARNAFEFIHPDDQAYAQNLLAGLLQRPGDTVTAEIRLRHKDGAWRWMETVGTNLLDEPGVSAIVVNYRDITERRRAEEAHSQLAAIVESSDDAIISKDLDGIILSWNAGAEKIYGYSADEIIGKPIALLMPPDRPDELPGIMERLRRGERIDHYETARVRQDGTRLDVSVSISPIRDAQGHITGAAVISRDITARKSQMLERARAEEQLKQRNRELAALNAIVTTVNESSELETILHAALEWLVAFVGVEAAECLLADDLGALTLAAQYGLDEKFMTGSAASGLRVERGVAAAALANRAPVYIADLRSDKRYQRRRLARAEGYLSLLCVPIISRAALLGTINLYSRAPRVFSDELQRLLMTVAAELAVAIERTRLYQTERQRAEQLFRSNLLITALGYIAARIKTASDLDSVLETLGNELRGIGVRCIVALYNPEDESLVIRYGSLESGALVIAERLSGISLRGFRLTRERFPLYAELVDQRKPGFVPDMMQLALAMLPHLARPLAERAIRLAGVTPNTAALYLPLVVESRVLGMMGLWGKILKESDLSSVTMLADQVALAIENARVFGEVQQLAITDALTGLNNRRRFFELAEREFARARRLDHPLAAIMLDLDYFKQVNDTYGHAIGDQVLHAVAERCQQNIRDIDILGRYGGEEFTILLPETEFETARRVAERLRAAVTQAPIVTAQGAIFITISVGVAQVSVDIPNLAALLDRADAAMYVAKRKGRNRVVVI